MKFITIVFTDDALPITFDRTKRRFTETPYGVRIHDQSGDWALYPWHRISSIHKHVIDIEEETLERTA